MKGQIQEGGTPVESDVKRYLKQTLIPRVP